jgi:hypothetical protein
MRHRNQTKYVVQTWAVYLELMQGQKKPLELIFKLYEVIKPNMLYKHGLAQVFYLELMQQKKPLELIFKLFEVINSTRYALPTMAGPWVIPGGHTLKGAPGTYLQAP